MAYQPTISMHGILSDHNKSPKKCPKNRCWCLCQGWQGKTPNTCTRLSILLPISWADLIFGLFLSNRGIRRVEQKSSQLLGPIYFLKFWEQLQPCTLVQKKKFRYYKKILAQVFARRFFGRYITLLWRFCVFVLPLHNVSWPTSIPPLHWEGAASIFPVSPIFSSHQNILYSTPGIGCSTFECFPPAMRPLCLLPRETFSVVLVAFFLHLLGSLIAFVRLAHLSGYVRLWDQHLKLFPASTKDNQFPQKIADFLEVTAICEC